MVTASVRLSLADEPDHETVTDRGRLASLEFVPDGARVVVDVAGRDWVTNEAARYLFEHSERLHLEIVGTDARAIARWVTAARTGVIE